MKSVKSTNIIEDFYNYNQILREINSGEFRVSKTAILRVLRMKNGRISPILKKSDLLKSSKWQFLTIPIH